MHSMRNPEPASRVEGALHKLYGGSTPDAAFLSGLEARLFERARALQPARTCRRPWAWAQTARRRSWAMASLALLLALATAFTVIGPQQVWAQVQRLLGYVPRVGFVDLESTRVLAAPVALTREGVTLVVEQALARPQGTTVVIRSEGLPSEDELRAAGRELAKGGEARLRLPDGEVLTPRTYHAKLGAATLEFAPLPQGVYQVTLELPRLPLAPDGVAPEGWEAPITLRPATGELVAELYPQPYAPEGAEETHNGVTVRVLQVAHGPEETAVRLQVQWEAEDWGFPHLDGAYVLRDDVGHSYFWPATPGSGSTVQTEVVAIDPSQAQPSPAVPTYEKVLTYAPLSSLARQLSLEIDRIAFGVPAAATFAIDLGQDPQVGDHWPLDIHLEVAGFPVHITGAWLEEEVVGARDQPERRTVLQLEIAPVPEQENRRLQGLGLDGEAAGLRSGSTGGYSYDTNRMHAGLVLKGGEPILHGPVQVVVRDAQVSLRGPWQIAWKVPGRVGVDAVAPVTLHPQDAHQERGGLGLRVDEVVLSDQLTAVTLALDEAPPGAKLSLVPFSDPASRGHSYLLIDDRGGRYEAGRIAAGWRPTGQLEPQAGTYTFGPVQPLARRLTLQVPGVQLALPGRAAFSVEVPAGLTVAPSSPDRQPSRKSAPWEVDIRLEVAGYDLRFREAWLEEINRTMMLYLLSEPYQPARQDRWLSALRPAAVTGPGGRQVDLSSAPTSGLVEVAFSAAGPSPAEGGKHYAVLAFDVADSETGVVRPGVYHVEVEGCNVAVRGPWELTWEVGGGG